MSIKQLGKVIEDVYADYEGLHDPFSSDLLITASITSQLDTGREKALFLTLTTSLNRGGRDAERMYGIFEQLWDDERWIFEPTAVIEDHAVDDLEATFDHRGTRYPRQDAKTWYEISRTLYEEFDGDPLNLLERFEYDVGAISEYVRDAEGRNELFVFNKRFPGLRGDKIRPLWLRLINDQVHPLSAQELSSIPVDTHIIQITNRICGTELSNTERDKERIRRFWRKVCNGTTVTPVEIDAPLWYLHRDWDTWGGQYFQRVMGEHALELGDVRFPFEADAGDTIQLSQSQIEEFANLADTEPDDIRKKIQDLDSSST